jgi:hypothetical protein
LIYDAPMPRRLAVAAWCLAALCGIAGALWAATPWVDFLIYRTNPPHCYEVHVVLGCIVAAEGGHGPHLGIRTGPYWRDPDWSWWFHYDRDGIIVIPLWSIIIATGPPAFFLFGAARRLRQRPGHCRACGYDRQGLSSDAQCPECGASPTPLAEHR